MIGGILLFFDLLFVISGISANSFILVTFTYLFYYEILIVRKLKIYRDNLKLTS